MSAFDGGKRDPGALAQMVHDVPAGTKPTARLRKFIVTGRRRARSSVAVLLPVVLLCTCVVVFAASDREDCADADNPDQKIASCSRVIADDAESAPNRAHAYGTRGAAYYDKGEFDRAIADFSQAIKLDPNYALAYNNRGFAYFRKNDFDRAIVDYTEAVKRNPNYALAYNNRGNAYFRTNDYDRAISDYSEAIRRNSNYPIAYDNRGFAYAQKNDYDHALADYDEAVRRNPRLASA